MEANGCDFDSAFKFLADRLWKKPNISFTADLPPLDAETGEVIEDAETRPTDSKWAAPKPLPDGLPPVDAFDSKSFLPVSIGPWVEDIAERMQCPPDFVGVSAMAALGAVTGCKIGILPEQCNDWYEVPNLWALAVGRPGTLKSPAMQSAYHAKIFFAGKKNQKDRVAQ
jgi:hypothetical protein